MARKIDLLTDVAIRQAKANAKPRRLFAGRRLYLLISPSGGKWWRFKYRRAGRQQLLSLGVYPEISLKDARERRDQLRRDLAHGIDPAAERKAAKLAQNAAAQHGRDTFEVLAREWFAKHQPTWAPNHSETVIRRLERDVFPWLGHRPILS